MEIREVKCLIQVKAVKSKVDLKGVTVGHVVKYEY